MAFFKPMKERWKRLVTMYRINNEGRDMRKENIPKALQDIFDQHSFATGVKKGFQSCGLFPFCADNVKYDRLLNYKSTTPATSMAKQNKGSNVDVSQHLKYLESKIPSVVLKNFQATSQKYTGDEKYAGLFDIWSAMLKDINKSQPTEGTSEKSSVELNNDSSEIFSEVQDEDNRSSQSVENTADQVNFEDLNDEQIFQMVDNLGDETLHFDQNDTLIFEFPEINSTDTSKDQPESIPNPYSQEADPQAFNEAVTQPSTTSSYELKESDNEPRSTQDILNELHLFPNKQVLYPKSNRRRPLKHLPSVMTHPLWEEMMLSKENKPKTRSKTKELNKENSPQPKSPKSSKIKKPRKTKKEYNKEGY